MNNQALVNSTAEWRVVLTPFNGEEGDLGDCSWVDDTAPVRVQLWAEDRQALLDASNALDQFKLSGLPVEIARAATVRLGDSEASLEDFLAVLLAEKISIHSESLEMASATAVGVVG